MPQYGHEGGKQDSAGYSVVKLHAFIDAGNTTEDQLGNGGVFNGVGVDTDGYGTLLVTLNSDQPSVADGLEFQFSNSDPAGSPDWHASDNYTIGAGSYKTYTIQPVDRWFRLVYTNGVTPTTQLHITTRLFMSHVKPSSHRLADDLSTQDDAELVKAVLAAEKPNGIVTNIDATAGGNLKVAIEEFDESLTSVDGYQIVTSLPAALEIPEGEIVGHYAVNKFGRTTNADANDPTDVWDRANPVNDQAIWLAPTASRIHAIVSTSDIDGKTGAPSSAGAKTIQVYGLADWDTPESSEIITLDGTTPVNTVSAYCIIHRMKVLDSGASGPNVGTITATAATDGTITAQVQPLEGQTQMAIYGIPSTQTLFIVSFYINIERDSPTGTSALARLLWTMNVENQSAVFLVKHTVSLEDGADVQHNYNPYNKFTGPGILKIQVNSSDNDTFANSGFDLILVDNN